jgi:hypothetical protein
VVVAEGFLVAGLVEAAAARFNKPHICHSDDARKRKGGIRYSQTAFVLLSRSSRFLLVASLLVGMKKILSLRCRLGFISWR